MFLTEARRRGGDAAAFAVAAFGAWLMWSLYSSAATVSWFYDHLEHIKHPDPSAPMPAPDYDLRTLPWKSVAPRTFDLGSSGLAIATNAEPYAYQAFAILEAKGARAVDIVFDATIETGGATIGVLQRGKWIAVNSAQRPGRFADANTAELGREGSLTVVIANNNAAGVSRITIQSLRVYLR